jgi:hypothetical protein
MISYYVYYIVMIESTTLVDEDFLLSVATDLCEGWQIVLKQLGQTDAFIEQLQRDFSLEGLRWVSKNLINFD